MTNKAYLSSDLLTMTTTVIAIGGTDRPWVRLADTLFHPQGGGQKADRGLIAGVAVVHVAHDNGDVNHFVESAAGLAVGGSVEIRVDSDWRRSNAALHTGGHAVAGVLEHARPSLRPLAAHHWPGEARVEFEGPVDDPETIREIVAAAMGEAIRSRTTVNIAQRSDGVRTVQVGAFSPVPCGGTHLSNLGDLATFQVVGVKLKGGKLRVSYDAKPRLGSE